MHLHHTCELLLKIYHTLDMSQISAENLNHYTVVYGLTCRRLEDGVAGHWDTHWRSMKDCFRDICALDASYKRDKGYCIAEFDNPEASTINTVKSTKDPGLYFRCGGPHLQNRCTKHRYQPNYRLQNTLYA